MPLVSPMVIHDGSAIIWMVGGRSVPIRHALKSGNAKIIVVLTRNPGLPQEPVSKGTAKFYRKAYRASKDGNVCCSQESYVLPYDGTGREAGSRRKNLCGFVRWFQQYPD